MRKARGLGFGRREIHWEGIIGRWQSLLATLARSWRQLQTPLSGQPPTALPACPAANKGKLTDNRTNSCWLFSSLPQYLRQFSKQSHSTTIHDHAMASSSASAVGRTSIPQQRCVDGKLCEHRTNRLYLSCSCSLVRFYQQIEEIGVSDAAGEKNGVSCQAWQASPKLVRNVGCQALPTTTLFIKIRSR